MRARLAVTFLLALTGCGEDRPKLITGPFTGQTYRFALSGLVLPENPRLFGADLNGDGRLDNQLGQIVNLLDTQGNLTDAIGEMIGSGVLAATLEITSDDPELYDDPTVGVRLIGVPGTSTDLIGAEIHRGRLQSNQTKDLARPVRGTIALPLFLRADPIVVEAIGIQLLLKRGADGSLTGQINGAVFPWSFFEPAHRSFTQMIDSNPQDFPGFFSFCDRDGDGRISLEELFLANIARSWVRPDVQLTDGAGGWAPSRQNDHPDALSFGIGVAFKPCAQGSCANPPVRHCFDRIQDGNETDIDCGGSCLPCPGAAACRVPADCQSRRCTAGRCEAPSCDDGLRNGAESGVDCGRGCMGCQDGTACRSSFECASNRCSDELLGLFVGGTCQPAFCHDGIQNGDETDIDCGGPCPPCAIGQHCKGSADCAGGICQQPFDGDSSGVCVQPPCNDGKRSSEETDVDCGGGCPGCPSGARCNWHTDCASGFCQADARCR